MKMISIPGFLKSRKGIIAVVAVMFLLLLLLVSQLSFQSNSLNAFFENSQVGPGEQAVLMVRVYNNAGGTTDFTVIASTSSDNLVISNAVQEESKVGAGESRLFSFNVLVKPDARKGDYVVRVNVPQLNEEAKVFLKVV